MKPVSPEKNPLLQKSRARRRDSFHNWLINFKQRRIDLTARILPTFSGKHKKSPIPPHLQLAVKYLCELAENLWPSRYFGLRKMYVLSYDNDMCSCIGIDEIEPCQNYNGRSHTPVSYREIYIYGGPATVKHTEGENEIAEFIDFVVRVNSGKRVYDSSSRRFTKPDRTRQRQQFKFAKVAASTSDSWLLAILNQILNGDYSCFSEDANEFDRLTRFNCAIWDVEARLNLVFKKHLA